MGIAKIGVVGAGQMGSGIAQVSLMSGYQVVLNDVADAVLAKSREGIGKGLDILVRKEKITAQDEERMLSGLLTTTGFDGFSSCDLVVEAATEREDLKLSIFRKLDEAVPAGRILATNTSSISITKIAAATKRPGKVIGMHFMNPVPVMKLVEIINGYATDKSVTDTIVELSRQLGKVPCVVNDYPGFIANRILMPMINEAIYSLYEGVAGVEEIDTVMKLGMAHPMGPLPLADFIGLDVCHSILNVLHSGFGNQKYAPCPLLVNMVTAGYIGVKTGEGFYRYQAGSKELVVSERF